MSSCDESVPLRRKRRKRKRKKSAEEEMFSEILSGLAILAVGFCLLVGLAAYVWAVLWEEIVPKAPPILDRSIYGVRANKSYG